MKNITQIEITRSGRVSAAMRSLAKREGVSPEFLIRGVADGRIVIPGNRLRKAVARPCAIGQGLRTKINANIGTSKGSSNIACELAKMRAAESLGADTIMDLSTGPRVALTRRSILSKAKVPVGTVPIYEAVVNALARGASISEMSADEIFAVLEAQAADGVDFFTIHAGVTRNSLKVLKERGRVLGIVSRGGAFLAQWMLDNGRENPFYEYFDRVLDIARRYDLTLSLGDGLRPGSILDATDSPQLAELVTLGDLRNRALEYGVQSMIEGPGHVPINQIESNVLLEKAICNGAPFYVLGPLVTDIAPGYDHITSAIGGAIAAAKGADFLCYVTPSEHLRLPTVDDVKEGVIASKIAAHAADIAKGIAGASARDGAISRARAERDWAKQFDLALDGARPRAYRKSSRPGRTDACTMCGDFCSIKISQGSFKNRRKA